MGGSFDSKRNPTISNNQGRDKKNGSRHRLGFEIQGARLYIYISKKNTFLFQIAGSSRYVTEVEVARFYCFRSFPVTYIEMPIDNTIFKTIYVTDPIAILFVTGPCPASRDPKV